MTKPNQRSSQINSWQKRPVPERQTSAQAYGFYGERVEKTADFADAFARALASDTGAVLDLVISTEAITPRQTIDDLRRANS